MFLLGCVCHGWVWFGLLCFGWFGFVLFRFVSFGKVQTVKATVLVRSGPSHTVPQCVHLISHLISAGEKIF